jgi:ketosteroid isomerase-like protein
VRDELTAWVDGYERAWRSNDRDEIAALFAEDARYLASPSSEAVVGRDAIVEWWLANADAPDDARFSYEVIGVDGRRGFVQGVTVYRASADQPERTYDNLWVIDLADDGRARSYTEWYHRRHG